MNQLDDKASMAKLVTVEDGRTVWVKQAWATEARGGMVLTPRIDCSSLRLRRSEPGYQTDWHVAGDPALIVVQRGVLRIELRDGSVRDFSSGQAFIAADALAERQTFDPSLHGHRAEVIGDEALEAVHIKLVV